MQIYKEIEVCVISKEELGIIGIKRFYQLHLKK